ncbi:hypothetical protein [Paraburkholderia sp.]|nr:hypothetical protein [Paraburkholderia sp.]
MKRFLNTPVHGVIFTVMGMSVVLVPGARRVLIHVVRMMRDRG